MPLEKNNEIQSEIHLTRAERAADRLKSGVKICGLTSLEDAQKAILSGASLLGFIFVKSSPRCISSQTAQMIISQLKADPKGLGAEVSMIAVFQNPTLEAIQEVVTGGDGSESNYFDGIQLHGEESREFCRLVQDTFGLPVIKYLPLAADDFDLEQLVNQVKHFQNSVDVFLLEPPKAHPDYGQFWEQSRVNIKVNQVMAYWPWILAGGLTPENINTILQIYIPSCVDVASGVEIQPGVKNKLKMQQFCNAFYESHCFKTSYERPLNMETFQS
jgi:phosphoribosylanthranilate isomerase